MRTRILQAVQARPPQTLPLPTGFVDAAVLIPIWEGKLLFTVRSSDLPHHAAQISFPGGRFDAGETAEAAALREAWEEVGLEPSNVEILGHLNPTLSPFGYRVFPLVGHLYAQPQLKPNPNEVGELLWVSIDDLRKSPAYAEERPINRLPANLRPEIREVVLQKDSGFRSHIWHYPWQGYDIWGMTGNIVHDFLERLEGKV